MKLSRFVKQSVFTGISRCKTNEICNVFEKSSESLYQFLGFVHRNEKNGKFITLRDSFGQIQLIGGKDKRKDFIRLGIESAVRVIGTIIKRPESQRRYEEQNGQFEVKVEYIEGNVSKWGKLLPVSHLEESNEITRMEYRCLDLRRENMQNALSYRSKLYNNFTNYLFNNDFTFIDTPTLSWKGCSGSKEFKVVSNNGKNEYNLVQSPQIYKQMLMASGVEKYFQLARCYRDEKSNSQRQFEFVQLDIEQAYASSYDIMKCIEDMLINFIPQESVKLFHDKTKLSFLKRNNHLKIPIISFHDSLKYFGTDKPDLRIESVIVKVEKNLCLMYNFEKCTESVNIIPSLPEIFSNIHSSLKSHFTGSLNLINSSIFWIISDKNCFKVDFSNDKILFTKEEYCNRFDNFCCEIKKTTKLLWEKNDKDKTIYIISKNTNERVMGQVRSLFVDQLEIIGIDIKTNNNNFLWVNDFPLFEVDKSRTQIGHYEKFQEILENDLNGTQYDKHFFQSVRICSSHHPFTSPLNNDWDCKVLNESFSISNVDDFKDIFSIVADHYDLVLNGEEVGGGSVRIDNYDKQCRVLDLLRYSHEPFEPLLKALECGCPPHAGIALGIDRLVAILLKKESIRDVVAFPKKFNN